MLVKQGKWGEMVFMKRLIEFYYSFEYYQMQILTMSEKRLMSPCSLKKSMLTYQKKKAKFGTVVHACKPSTGEAEAGGYQVQGQPEQFDKTLCQNKIMKGWCRSPVILATWETETERVIV
jgi:hypothetical protein